MEDTSEIYCTILDECVFLRIRVGFPLLNMSTNRLVPRSLIKISIHTRCTDPHPSRHRSPRQRAHDRANARQIPAGGRTRGRPYVTRRRPYQVGRDPRRVLEAKRAGSCRNQEGWGSLIMARGSYLEEVGRNLYIQSCKLLAIPRSHKGNMEMSPGLKEKVIQFNIKNYYKYKSCYKIEDDMKPQNRTLL